MHLYGFVPGDEMPLCFSSADLLVLPGCDRAEGSGMVLNEAQACGAPVIGMDIGGVSSYDRIFHEAVLREGDPCMEPEKEGVMNWRLSSS